MTVSIAVTNSASIWRPMNVPRMREDADDHDHVMDQRDDGRDAHPEVAEPERDPEHDADDAHEDQQERLLDELGADDRADGGPAGGPRRWGRTVLECGRERAEASLGGNAGDRRLLVVGARRGALPRTRHPGRPTVPRMAAPRRPPRPVPRTQPRWRERRWTPQPDWPPPTTDQAGRPSKIQQAGLPTMSSDSGPGLADGLRVDRRRRVEKRQGLGADEDVVAAVGAGDRDLGAWQALLLQHRLDIGRRRGVASSKWTSQTVPPV